MAEITERYFNIFPPSKFHLVIFCAFLKSIFCCIQNVTWKYFAKRPCFHDTGEEGYKPFPKDNFRLFQTERVEDNNFKFDENGRKF